MKTDMIKTLKFDMDTERRYQAILTKMQNISDKNNELLKQYADDLSPVQNELRENSTKLEQLTDDIWTLIPFDEVAFEKYANQMYQNIMTTIVNDTTLSNNTINFANMDNKQRADFGTRLFQKLAQRYGEKNHTKLKFEIKDIESGQKSGGYDWKNTISIAPHEATDFTNFILIFAHEFSHYVYIKQPQKAPLTVQQRNIAKKHYYSPPIISTKKAFERYKNQPFELPSYKLMDYFTEHNFIEKLATAIRTKQNNFSRDTI